MKLLPGFVYLTAALCFVGLSPESDGQTLPGSLGISVAGSFVNGTAQSQNSILITDNDLTNGYDPGFDLTDAPPASTRTARPDPPLSSGVRRPTNPLIRTPARFGSAR